MTSSDAETDSKPIIILSVSICESRSRSMNTDFFKKHPRVLFKKKHFRKKYFKNPARPTFLEEAVRCHEACVVGLDGVRVQLNDDAPPGREVDPLTPRPGRKVTAEFIGRQVVHFGSFQVEVEADKVAAGPTGGGITQELQNSTKLAKNSLKLVNTRQKMTKTSQKLAKTPQKPAKNSSKLAKTRQQPAKTRKKFAKTCQHPLKHANNSPQTRQNL